MENNKSIEVLNSILEINNDRIEGYNTALKETEDTDLKAQFLEFIQTSNNCREELITEITRMGGTPIEGTKTTGKLFRLWMEFKATLTGNDRKAILNSCEFGEDAAVETYQTVLEDHSNDISAEQQTLIRKQLAMILANHNKVKELRDIMVDQD